MNLQSIVYELIGQLTTLKKSFTAFDITIELRSKFPQEHIYHYEVKPLVHDYMNTNCINDYAGKQDFTIHTNGPIVYKPISDKHDIVVDKDKTLYTNNMPPVTIKTDKRGRLCIPVQMLRKMTTTFDKYIEVGIVDKSIVASIDLQQNKSIGDTKTYKIDKYGNVRISNAIVSKLGDYVKYKIYLSDNLVSSTQDKHVVIYGVK